MRFNVVVFDSKNQTYLSEFKHDKIIRLDKLRINRLIGVDSDSVEPEIANIMLKIALIKKYKRLIFIDSKFVSIKEGLRKEIVQLYKLPDILYMMNTRNIVKNDIFFSKKCPSFLKGELLDLKNSLNYKNFFLKKEVYHNYIFKNISWENLPYEEW